MTKSGTNQFRGAVFEFFRDKELNARRWTIPGVPKAEKDPLRRHQYGGAFGGPIRLNKTFFFTSYSGLRQTETYYRDSAIVPTARERAGDFSQSAQKPRDPNTNAPFTGDIIPAGRMDAVALRIQEQFVPLTNFPGNRYQLSVPDSLETDEGTLKVDHHFTDRHSLAASYFYLRATTRSRSRVRAMSRGSIAIQVDAAQRQHRRYLDVEPNADQSIARHLHAAVRWPRQ